CPGSSRGSCRTWGRPRGACTSPGITRPSGSDGCRGPSTRATGWPTRSRERRRSMVAMRAVPVALLLGLAGAAAAAEDPVAAGTRNGQWPSYNGDVRGSRYSPVDQIDASNFSQLEVVWRFKTDSLGTRPEYKLEGTPLMVGGVLYA